MKKGKKKIERKIMKYSEKRRRKQCNRGLMRLKDKKHKTEEPKRHGKK